eukprot:15106269-Alexandrium_andersonii.AAC.1
MSAARALPPGGLPTFVAGDVIVQRDEPLDAAEADLAESLLQAFHTWGARPLPVGRTRRGATTRAALDVVA